VTEPPESKKMTPSTAEVWRFCREIVEINTAALFRHLENVDNLHKA
jgi:hypothetical protein